MTFKPVMAFLGTALSLTFAINSQAADRKLGSVVAVERTIENVYQSCVDQITPDQMKSNYYSCVFEGQKKAVDFTPGRQSFLAVYDKECSVEAAAEKGKVMIIFNGRQNNANFNDAKTCLRKALDASKDKDSFKFTVFVVE